mgnify:FL=1
MDIGQFLDRGYGTCLRLSDTIKHKRNSTLDRYIYINTYLIVIRLPIFDFLFRLSSSSGLLFPFFHSSFLFSFFLFLIPLILLFHICILQKVSANRLVSDTPAHS